MDLIQDVLFILRDFFLILKELKIHFIISVTHLSYCVFIFIESIDSTMMITSFQFTDKK